MMRKKNLKKGFTLVEALIAMLLLLITFAGGATLFFNADRFIGYVVHKKLAVALINLKMEEIKGHGYDYQYAPLQYIGDPFPAAVTVETETIDDLDNFEGFSFQRTISVLDIDDPAGGSLADYKEITVAVTWTESLEDTLQTLSIVTYLAP